MKAYRPLLLNEIDLRLPGLHIHRLALNRHLPEVDEVREHAHGYHQILCYLGGRGEFRWGGLAETIGTGSVVLVPPRVRHAFAEGGGRRALCLVIDLTLGENASGENGPVFRQMNLSQTALVRRELSEIARAEGEAGPAGPGGPGTHPEVAAAILIVLGQLLQALGRLRPRRPAAAPFLARVNRIIASAEQPLLPVSEIAAAAGYQRDHLNRLCRAATGLTLREHRDEQVLARARAELRRCRSVAEACARIGFDDTNYFARWFRKHTGRQPREMLGG